MKKRPDISAHVGDVDCAKLIGFARGSCRGRLLISQKDKQGTTK